MTTAREYMDKAERPGFDNTRLIYATLAVAAAILESNATPPSPKPPSDPYEPELLGLNDDGTAQ